MKLSFKKRIALFNTIAVAITMAIVFLVIYAVAHFSSMHHLDNDIAQRKSEISTLLHSENDSIIVSQMRQWEQAQQKKLQVNPTFIEITDKYGKVIFRSANLQANHFLNRGDNTRRDFYNLEIGDQRLRIGKFLIRNDDGKIIGYFAVGISRRGSYYVLNNLLFTLCILFPVVLLVMYAAIYLTASKAIAPVHRLIQTASGITHSNINKRLPLPENEDELFQLATTINELLQRLENSIQQQRQFTADASHEIKTPLAAIKGNLEILLRKNVDTEQYHEKIKEAIRQTDTLNYLVQQLLQLARMESASVKKEIVSLYRLVTDVAKKWEKQIAERNMTLTVSFPRRTVVLADEFLTVVIMDNLFSNAIKYGKIKGKILCDWDEAKRLLSVSNEGPQIPAAQIPFLFNRFYRVDDSRSSKIPGTGLGLAIVKQLCDLQHITLSVESHDGITAFYLQFPANA
jgi:signal transduction histidine kinase